jgi:hypothetical protein
VSHKTLRISKTFGIETGKLLRPDDDYEIVKEFNQDYEGETTLLEAMRLELQGLLKADLDLGDRLDALPGRVFSGKRHPQPGTRAVFFCYRIPHPDHTLPVADGQHPYTEEAGETKWYLYDVASEKILEEPTEMIGAIRCVPDTARHCEIEQPTLAEIRGRIEKHIKNTRLKQLQAPMGVKPLLKVWMELN